MSRRLAQLLCASVLGGSLGLPVAWAQSLPGVPGSTANPSLQANPSGTGTGSNTPAPIAPTCLYGMDSRGNCLPTPGTSTSPQLPTRPSINNQVGTGLNNPYGTTTTPGTSGMYGTETTAPGTYTTPGSLTPDSRTLSPRTYSPSFETAPGSNPVQGSNPVPGTGSTSSPGPGLNSPGASPTLPPTGPTTPR
jgi:hypothetical protein